MSLKAGQTVQFPNDNFIAKVATQVGVSLESKITHIEHGMVYILPLNSQNVFAFTEARMQAKS